MGFRCDAGVTCSARYTPRLFRSPKFFEPVNEATHQGIL